MAFEIENCFQKGKKLEAENKDLKTELQQLKRSVKHFKASESVTTDENLIKN